jgi:predicted RNase H-like nuclease (RuvC/YqgF family)
MAFVFLPDNNNFKLKKQKMSEQYQKKVDELKDKISDLQNQIDHKNGILDSVRNRSDKSAANDLKLEINTLIKEQNQFIRDLNDLKQIYIVNFDGESIGMDGLHSTCTYIDHKLSIEDDYVINKTNVEFDLGNDSELKFITKIDLELMSQFDFERVGLLKIKTVQGM